MIVPVPVASLMMPSLAADSVKVRVSSGSGALSPFTVMSTVAVVWSAAKFAVPELPT